MLKQKFTLKFINNGDPFEMPNWTPEKHEAALSKLDVEQQKNKWNDRQADNEFKYYVIYETLVEIDPNCDFEKVRKLHPATLIELFREVYYAGKENIYYQDFRKGHKAQKSKK
ncbi:MAG: hypothetical protein ACFFDS_08875 [Candidatus Thorarchaeota archaeon]